MSDELNDAEVTAACRRIERALAARINARNVAEAIEEGRAICACGAIARRDERACGRCIYEGRR